MNTMKKIFQNLLLAIAILGLGFLASCGGGDEVDPTAPTVEFEEGTGLISSDTTLSTDTTILIGIKAEQGTFAMRSFMLTAGNDQIVDISELSGDSTESFSGTQPIMLPGTAGEFKIEAIVTDEEGNSSSTVLTLNVEEPNVMINEVRLLAAPLDNFDSKTFYSTNMDALYSMNNVLNTSQPLSQEIDFGYAFGQTDGAILASPGTYPSFVGGGTYKDAIEANWSVKNLTEFRTTNLSEEAFDNITVLDEETIVDEYEAGTSVGNNISNLEEGQVVAFQTKTNQTGESKFGLLKVVAIEPGSGSTDFITIQVKVQI